MRIAARIGRAAPSPTLAVTAQAAALRAQGVDVVDFGVGQPDFDTPAHVVRAAHEALDRGDTRYTPASGTPLLRKTVAEYASKARGVQWDADNVIISCGGKHALYNLFMSIFEAGDEVLIPAPYWVSYPEMVKLADADPVIVETTEQDGFRLRPETLRAAITQRTRALIINSPSNPTGAAYDAPSLRALAEVLREHPDVYVISDDIYDELAYDGFRFVSILDEGVGGPQLADRTFIVSGASKTWSMTGWRIGWTIGPKDAIKAMGTLQSQSTSNPTSFAQAGAVAALRGGLDFLEPRLEAFSQRRRYVVERLRALPHVSCFAPQGAFYVFPNFRHHLEHGVAGRRFADDVELCGWLLREHKVALVPGSAFGAPGYLRISYALDMATLEKGMDRIAAALGPAG